MSSNVSFSSAQIRTMSEDIGEILGRLKEKNVLDFEKALPIILVNRSSANIEFKATHVLELKRFTSLIERHIAAFRYLVTNHTFINETIDVMRSDRITGSINYGQTAILMKKHGTNLFDKRIRPIVVCSEINRNYDTHENRLLALILISAMIYSDKFVTMTERMIISVQEINPTIMKLQFIRKQLAVLLAEKSIRQILPVAIDSRTHIDELFELMRKRIQNGRTPRYFAQIYNLFYKWRYYTRIKLENAKIAKDILYYHFMNLRNQNPLYECWIFCKLLYVLSLSYHLRFVESRSIKGAKKGFANFISNDKSIGVTYQPVYLTDWEDQSLPESSRSRFLEDIPDISIDFLKKGTCIILDAKNSYLKYRTRPYRHRMTNYMTTSNSRYGILIHSDSERQVIFESISKKITNQQII